MECERDRHTQSEGWSVRERDTQKARDREWERQTHTERGMECERDRHTQSEGWSVRETDTHRAKGGV